MEAVRPSSTLRSRVTSPGKWQLKKNEEWKKKIEGRRNYNSMRELIVEKNNMACVRGERARKKPKKTALSSKRTQRSENPKNEKEWTGRLQAQAGEEREAGETETPGRACLSGSRVEVDYERIGWRAGFPCAHKQKGRGEEKETEFKPPRGPKNF